MLKRRRSRTRSMLRIWPKRKRLTKRLPRQRLFWTSKRQTERLPGPRLFWTSKRQTERLLTKLNKEKSLKERLLRLREKPIQSTDQYMPIVWESVARLGTFLRTAHISTTKIVQILGKERIGLNLQERCLSKTNITTRRTKCSRATSTGVRTPLWVIRSGSFIVSFLKI